MMNRRATADRIRPMLAAMERSIDAARRCRTATSSPPSTGWTGSSEGTTPPVRKVAQTPPAEPASGKPRARPKAPSAFFRDTDTTYRRAG